MTRSELVTAVENRLPYLRRKDAEIIVNTLFDSMVEALAQGDRIDIRGFGSLAVKHRTARREGIREQERPFTSRESDCPNLRLARSCMGESIRRL